MAIRHARESDREGVERRGLEKIEVGRLGNTTPLQVFLAMMGPPHSDVDVLLERRDDIIRAYDDAEEDVAARARNGAPVQLVPRSIKQDARRFGVAIASLLARAQACMRSRYLSRFGGMAEVSLDALEREQLCDLLLALGPDAPTLIKPWSARDLAAHLVLREHDPLAAPGLIIPGPWHQFAERRTAELAEHDFATLVDQVRSGPPPGFFRIGWVRRLANLNELFVHHEDVRRANGWGPRSHEPKLEAALWRNVARTPWFLARRLRGVGLQLEWAGTNKRVRARRGKPTACLTGMPGELLLYLFGRQRVARVDVAGAPAAVAAVRATSFGM